MTLKMLEMQSGKPEKNIIAFFFVDLFMCLLENNLENVFLSFFCRIFCHVFLFCLFIYFFILILLFESVFLLLLFLTVEKKSFVLNGAQLGCETHPLSDLCETILPRSSVRTLHVIYAI